MVPSKVLKQCWLSNVYPDGMVRPSSHATMHCPLKPCFLLYSPTKYGVPAPHRFLMQKVLTTVMQCLSYGSWVRMLRAIDGDLEWQETGFCSDHIFPLGSSIIPVRIRFCRLIHLGMHPQCRQLYWGLCLQKGKTPMSYSSRLWPMCCQAG